MPPSASASGMLRTRWLVSHSQLSGRVRSASNSIADNAELSMPKGLFCIKCRTRPAAQPPRPVATTNRCTRPRASRQPTGLPRRRRPRPSSAPICARFTTKRAGCQAWCWRSNHENAICTSGALSRVPANQNASRLAALSAGIATRLLACAAGVFGGIGITPPSIRCTALSGPARAGAGQTACMAGGGRPQPGQTRAAQAARARSRERMTGFSMDRACGCGRRRWPGMAERGRESVDNAGCAARWPTPGILAHGRCQAPAPFHPVAQAA